LPQHAANDFEVIGDLTRRGVRELANEILGVKPSKSLE
jgi:hypothetical protein